MQSFGIAALPVIGESPILLKRIIPCEAVLGAAYCLCSSGEYFAPIEQAGYYSVCRPDRVVSEVCIAEIAEVGDAPVSEL